MKIITKKQLKNILKRVRGAQPVSLIALTAPETVSNCPYEIKKIAKISGFIGVNYERAVNKKLKKIGKFPNFKSSPRIYGTRCQSIINYKKSVFLPIHISKSKSEYLVYKGTKLNIVSKDKIAKYLKISKKNLVSYRNYNVDNILSINMMGKKYIIKN